MSPAETPYKTSVCGLMSFSSSGDEARLVYGPVTGRWILTG